MDSRAASAAIDPQQPWQTESQTKMKNCGKRTKYLLTGLVLFLLTVSVTHLQYGVPGRALWMPLDKSSTKH
jgi:hypothetical protein